MHSLILLISTYFMGCVCTKSWPWKKKISISSIQNWAGPDLVFLGYQTIWRPLKVVKLTRNWKSMWKSYTVDISYLMGKNFLFLIFWTLLSENWPFSVNFKKIWNLAKSSWGIYKICPKLDLVLIFEPFLLKPFITSTKIYILLNLIEKWPIFTKQSPTNEEQKFFFIRYQMSTVP